LFFTEGSSKVFRLLNCYFVDADADPEEAPMSLSGSPPQTSHVTSADKVKDATPSVHVATTSSATAVSSGTVQSPPPASRLAK